MLNWYSYGARFYDPALGRFHCLDPYAATFCTLTPYHYCANNPIKYIDVNGEYFTGAFEKWANKIDDYFNQQISSKQNQIFRKEVRRANAEIAGNTKKADRLERGIQRNESQLVGIKDNFDEVKGE